LAIITSQIEENERIKSQNVAEANFSQSFLNFNRTESNTSTQINKPAPKYFPSRHQLPLAGTSNALSFPAFAAPAQRENEPAQPEEAASSSQIRTLQNKCTALERQIKRFKESKSAPNAKELEQLLQKIRVLESEKEEYRKQLSKVENDKKASISSLSEQLNLCKKELEEYKELIAKWQASENVQNEFHEWLIPQEPNQECRELLEDHIAEIKDTIQLCKVDDKASVLQTEIDYLKSKLIEVCILSKDDISCVLSVGNLTEIIQKVAHLIVHREKFRHKVIFTKQEFAGQHLKCLSTQYRTEKKIKDSNRGDDSKSKNWYNEVENLVRSDKLYEMEMFPEYRQVITLVACIVKFSKQLTQDLLLTNISTTRGKFECFVHAITQATDPLILRSRLLYHYSGLTRSLAMLLVNLSSFYDKFDDLKQIDNIFFHFFEHILMMSSNDGFTLTSLIQFLINISINPEKIGLLQRLCSNYPSSAFETSRVFNICSIPRSACKLQIFFLLLQTTFPFFEPVLERNIDLLHTMTRKLNILADIFTSYAERIFLRFDTHCSCFRFFIKTLIILNVRVMKSSHIQFKLCKINFF
jgi:hypothetical protein